MKASFRIAVVIPTLRRPIPLAEALRSLRGSLVAVSRVIVVDASPESAEASLRAESWPFSLEYLRSDRVGAAYQRNLALARLTDEEFVLFLDDDAVVEPDCIGELFEGFSRVGEPVAGVMANFHNLPVKRPGLATRLALWISGGGWHAAYDGLLLGPAVSFLPSAEIQERFLPIMWTRGGCVLYRRSALPESGFRSFFEGYSLGEDLALSRDAQRKIGGILLYASRARVIHSHGATTHPSARDYGRMEVRHRWYLMRDVMEKRGARATLGFATWMLWEMLAGCRQALRAGEFRRFLENARGRCSALREILLQS